MTYKVFYDEVGKILALNSDIANHPDLPYIDIGEDPIDIRFFYVDNGLINDIGVQLSENHVFDYHLKQWVDSRTLDEIKQTKREYVNTARATANQSSFKHLGKDIAVDQLSRSDIDAINGQIANIGTFPAGWPGAWKCIDNTYLPISTISDWVAFYTSMVNQGTLNFAHAQTLKTQIEVAVTAEEVEAVVW